MNMVNISNPEWLEVNLKPEKSKIFLNSYYLSYHQKRFSATLLEKLIEPTCRKSLPSRATRLGLVVTPSRMPRLAVAGSPATSSRRR